MPYIKPSDKARLDAGLCSYNEEKRAQTAGELNYLFTTLAIEYLNTKGLNYQNINDVVGALDGAKVEFQRRVVAGYEDKKIAENGDVYPEYLKTKGQY
jgi:hypothetical protein